MFARCLMAVLAGALSAGCSRSKAAGASAAGAQLYQQNCRGCHGSDGKGAPTACPPLAGHAAELLAAPGGRAHLVRVPLFGLTGPIDAAGHSFSGVMPPFINRSDAEIAAILNHVATAWGNDGKLPPEHGPFTPEEVAAERARGLTAQAVLAGRPALRASTPTELRQ